MDYFSSVTSGLVNLLNDILKEEGSSLFRRGPQVIYGSQSGSDYALSLRGSIDITQEKDTFISPVSDDRFLVFRIPGKIRMPFVLTGPGNHSFSAYDKLLSYFFDHRSLDPFVPERLKRYPPLYERIFSHKAEIRMKQGDASSLSFGFEYSALYHSGNFLREEAKTKQRVVEFKDPQERRIP
jgi:hypothetical protein